MSNRFLSVSRIIKTGLTNLFRNISLSAAAIAVMAITLTIILFSILANATLQNTIAQINNEISISVWLNDSVTTTQVNSLMASLKVLPNVKSVSYISKVQALAIYKAEQPSNSQLQQEISETDNPLPASVEIKPVDSNKIQTIEDFLNKPQVIALEDSQYGNSYGGDQKIAITKISHATNIIREGGIIAIVVFAAVSVLIIFNTIRMAIFNRRDEIRTMRLLGARTWYIRGPFVVESMCYGIFAAVLASLIVDAVFVASSSALEASSLGLLNINYAHTYFSEHLWILLTLELGIGIVIGAVSSVIATRRYLKFKTAR
jgi:cell division transport system permease protein